IFSVNKIMPKQEKQEDHLEEKKTKNVETTNHSWDGISEYDIPSPRWWLTVWIISIIFSIVYWVLYPAWPIPGGSTRGILKWDQQEILHKTTEEISARQSVYLEKFSKSS